MYLTAHCPYARERHLTTFDMSYEYLYGNKGVTASRGFGFGFALPEIRYPPQILCGCSVKIRKVRYEAGIIQTSRRDLKSFTWLGMCISKKSPSATYKMQGAQSLERKKVQGPHLTCCDLDSEYCSQDTGCMQRFGLYSNDVESIVELQNANPHLGADHIIQTFGEEMCHEDEFLMQVFIRKTLTGTI